MTETTNTTSNPANPPTIVVVNQPQGGTPVASPPKPKEPSVEYEHFENLTRSLLRISKDEISG